jgi:hypothetical protein
MNSSASSGKISSIVFSSGVWLCLPRDLGVAFFLEGVASSDPEDAFFLFLGVAGVV